MIAAAMQMAKKNGLVAILLMSCLICSVVIAPASTFITLESCAWQHPTPLEVVWARRMHHDGAQRCSRGNTDRSATVEALDDFSVIDLLQPDATGATLFDGTRPPDTAATVFRRDRRSGGHAAL